MPNPTTGWDRVPVYGKYGIPVTPDAGTTVPVVGSVRVTMMSRVYHASGRTIYPRGATLDFPLSISGEVTFGLPALDDGDVLGATPYKVEERFVNAQGATSFISPTLAMLALTPAGLDLTTVIVPDDGPTLAPPTALLKGVPGGVAGLDSAGRVLDASGAVVQSVDVSGLATTAAVDAKYTRPGAGIPSSDLAAAVTTSLTKADTATQPAALTSAINAERATVITTTPTVVAFAPSDTQASIQARIDSAPTGARLWFAPGTYALSGAGLVLKTDRTQVEAAGATFQQAAWETPVFDLLDRSDCSLDVGLAEFVGARSGMGTAKRGSAGYCSSAGVWANGDRNRIRIRTKNMAVGVFLASWNGTSASDRYGQSNRIEYLECEGANFGVLWVGQRNLVIDDLYVHDDIDDSVGANPTHAYYCSASEGFRSTGITIKKARAERILTGQPFQLKYTDGATLTAHSADASRGLINVLECNDLTWTGMTGTHLLPNAGQGAISIQLGASRTVVSATTTSGSPVVTAAAGAFAAAEAGRYVTAAGVPATARVLSVDSATQITLTAVATASATVSLTLSGPVSQRPNLTGTSVVMAAGVDERAVAIWADDARINGLSVTANRTGGATGDYDVILRGDRGRLRAWDSRSVGSVHANAGTIGYSSYTGSGWRVEAPTIDGPRAIMHVVGGGTDNQVSYNPAAQQRTGSAAYVAAVGTTTGAEFAEYVPAVKGVPNGYASLDSGAKVPVAQIPDLSGLYAAPTMYALSTFGVNAAADMLVTGSTSVPAANQAIQVKFRPLRSMTLASMRWFSTTLGTGSLYDIGLYEDASGAKLWTRGATAWPALGTVTETGCAGIVLDPAKWYRLAFASDSAGTVGQFAGIAAASADRGILADGRFVGTAVSTAMPLPATTLVAGSSGTGRVPLVRFHEA